MSNVKRVFIYISGLFFIALGATLSIRADIGVSPVTALPYCLALITDFSVGVMSVVSNVLYITIQAILKKALPWKTFCLQLLVAFMFGFFIDSTIWLTKDFPVANSIWYIMLYFGLSLLFIACGIMLNFTSKLPPQPYDGLTAVIAQKWNISFGRAKMSSDSINVLIAFILCVVFLHALGSIGIGTIIAAYGLGKFLGLFIKYVQPIISGWLYNNEENREENVIA